MPQEPEQHQIELLSSDEYTRYMLTTRIEIDAVMNELILKRVMLTALPEAKSPSSILALLAYQPETSCLLIDAASNEEFNARMSNARHCVLLGQLENIKIQFSVKTPKRIMHEGHAAFEAPLPMEVMRLQRREYYRLIAPVSHHLTCTIPVENEGKLSSIETRIVDISSGGIGIVVPPKSDSFKPGDEFPDCHMLLPDIGNVSVHLRVCSIFQVTRPNGNKVLRAGCQFVDLPGAIDSLVQKYILKVGSLIYARAR